MTDLFETAVIALVWLERREYFLVSLDKDKMIYRKKLNGKNYEVLLADITIDEEHTIEKAGKR